MKLFVVLYAADYTVRKAAFMHELRKGLPADVRGDAARRALLLREPDFGAFAVIAVIAMGILFLGGMNWRLFAGLAVLLATAFVALIVSSPRRCPARCRRFQDPGEPAEISEKAGRMGHIRGGCLMPQC